MLCTSSQATTGHEKDDCSTVFQMEPEEITQDSNYDTNLAEHQPQRSQVFNDSMKPENGLQSDVLTFHSPLPGNLILSTSPTTDTNIDPSRLRDRASSEQEPQTPIAPMSPTFLSFSPNELQNGTDGFVYLDTDKDGTMRSHKTKKFWKSKRPNLDREYRSHHEFSETQENQQNESTAASIHAPSNPIPAISSPNHAPAQGPAPVPVFPVPARPKSPISANFNEPAAKETRILQQSPSKNFGTSPIHISGPFNVVHRSHVDFNFQWTVHNPKETFEFMGLLGTGTYGKVYKSKQKETGFVLAIKVVRIKEESFGDVSKEMIILQKLKHPNIVSYYGCCNISKDELWLLMEYCDVGSVRDFMDMWPEPLTEAQIATILGDTLMGLAYLHGHSIAHRDIKAANILLDVNGRSKIGDFGVAGQLTKSVGKLHDFVGTVIFMAPEMLKEKATYDISADIWALGITSIEMAEQGQVPYCNDRMMTAIRKIIANPSPTFTEPSRWSRNFRDFLAVCLEKDPKRRPTAAALTLRQDTSESTNHYFQRSPSHVDELVV